MADKNDFELFQDGDKDLATSFWGYYFVGTIIVGLVCGYLSDTYSKWLILPYLLYLLIAIMGTWQTAEKYKLKQKKNKQSEVWGFLAQAMCVLGAIGTFTLVKDTFF